MRLINGFAGLLIVGAFTAASVSAQLGSGPESIMGLSSNKTLEFSQFNDDSQLSIARLESPLVKVADENGTGFPAFSLDYTGTGANNFYHVSLINRNDDLHTIAGLSFDTFKISAHYGNSDGIIRYRQDINGMSPNFFHGAVSYDYEYGGSTLGISLSDAFMIHGGATFIKAAGLENRSVYYSGFSYKSFYSTFSSVRRSDQTVGHSFVARYAFDDYAVSYQELISDHHANWREIALNLSNSEEPGTLKFGLGVGNNDLHEAGEETRVTLTYSVPLGAHKALLRPDQARAVNELHSKLAGAAKSFITIRNAGIGAVGSGVALSSGSARLDTTPRFRSQHRAAYYMLYDFNPISVRNNREYGSTIYRNRDRTYSPSMYVSLGAPDSVSVNPYYRIPYGTKPTAVWHTHGAYKPRYLNEQFSPADIQAAYYWNVDGYLGTPFGRMRFFDVDSGYIYTFYNEYGSDVVLPH